MQMTINVLSGLIFNHMKTRQHKCKTTYALSYYPFTSKTSNATKIERNSTFFALLFQNKHYTNQDRTSNL